MERVLSARELGQIMQIWFPPEVVRPVVVVELEEPDDWMQEEGCSEELAQLLQSFGIGLAPSLQSCGFHCRGRQCFGRERKERW